VRELRAMLAGGDLQARLDATIDHPARSVRAPG
jgi:hypothetical protein